MRLITFLNEVFDSTYYLRNPRIVAGAVASFLLDGEHLGDPNSSVYATDEILAEFEQWLYQEHGTDEPDYTEGWIRDLVRVWAEQRFVRDNIQAAHQTLRDINENIKGDQIILLRSSRLDPSDVIETIGGPPGKDRYPMSTLRRYEYEPITLGRFWTYDEKYAQQYHHTAGARHHRDVIFTGAFSVKEHVDINATIAVALIWNEREVRLMNKGFDIPVKLLNVSIEGKPLDMTYAKDKKYVTEISL